MNRSVGVTTAAALGLVAWTNAGAYTATADVTFHWATTGQSVAWITAGINAFPDPAIAGNDTRLTQAGGSNSTTWYNPDFATSSDYDGATTTDDCATLPAHYDAIVLRKYSCRLADSEAYYTALYHPAPVTDVGPGASATGTLSVTDTTLTGTLHVIATTDEPTGGSTVLFNGVSIGTSSGNGADGFNIRTADGSPFGNTWYGITTSATLAVNLTGTFTDSTWTIDGGAVTFSDPNFACQQGGFGGDARGTRCTPSTTGGGFQANGGHLSWGIDVDGAGTGALVATPIAIKDISGINTLATLSGVLAHLSIDVSGAITTTDGEFRYALGSAGGGCPSDVRWGGDNDPTPGGTSVGISCGTIGAGDLEITGTATTGSDPWPDPFAFVDQVDVPLATLVTSAAIVVAGIDAPSPISVTGDATSEYSIDGGAFTNVAGFVTSGQSVTVRHTSSASPSTVVTTTLHIGGVTDDFSSTTAGSDSIFFFSLVPQTGVPLSTQITSAPATIAGLSGPAPISVANGEYSIGCTATFVSTAGTIDNGQTVCVRHTSAATNDTDVTTTLTIDGVAANFVSTTQPEGTGQRDGDGGSSLDAGVLALLGVTALVRRRRRSVTSVEVAHRP